jgi:hypothetical protein
MSYSWSLTLITSSGLLLIIVTYAATTPFLVKRLNEVQHADIEASITANEVFSSIRMITACGASEKMARRYSSWVDESRRRGLKMSPLIAIQQAPGESLFPLHHADVTETEESAVTVQFAVYRWAITSAMHPLSKEKKPPLITDQHACPLVLVLPEDAHCAATQHCRDFNRVSEQKVDSGSIERLGRADAYRIYPPCQGSHVGHADDKVSQRHHGPSVGSSSGRWRSHHFLHDHRCPEAG